jgi:SAM-dependent MidA family methyltransferase
MIKINEALNTLYSLLNQLNEDKIFFSDKNEQVTKKIQANENKLSYCIDLITDLFNEIQLNEIQLKNRFKDLNNSINKLELICILYGIDDYNDYLKNYSFNDLLSLVKENRENKIVRLPLFFREIKPKYKFINEAGKLKFSGKI